MKKEHLKIAAITGGALVAIACFLPFVSMEVGGETQTILKGFENSEYGPEPGIILLPVGILAVVLALIGRKWSAIVTALFALLPLGIGIKYFSDVFGSEYAEKFADLGADFSVGPSGGLYLLMLGALICLVGGILMIFADSGKQKIADL